MEDVKKETKDDIQENKDSIQLEESETGTEKKANDEETKQNSENTNSDKITDLVFGDTINGVKSLGALYVIAAVLAISAVVLLLFFQKDNAKLVMLFLIIAFVIHVFIDNKK